MTPPHSCTVEQAPPGAPSKTVTNRINDHELSDYALASFLTTHQPFGRDKYTGPFLEEGKLLPLLRLAVRPETIDQESNP